MLFAQIKDLAGQAAGDKNVHLSVRKPDCIADSKTARPHNRDLGCVFLRGLGSEGAGCKTRVKWQDLQCGMYTYSSDWFAGPGPFLIQRRLYVAGRGAGPFQRCPVRCCRCWCHYGRV